MGGIKMKTSRTKPEVKKYIGEQIRMLRKEKGMTQKELGDLLGLKNNSISAIERGVNSFESNMMFKIAKIFNVKADDLFPPMDIEENPNEDLFRYAIRNTRLEAKEILIFKDIIEKTNNMTELEKLKYIENLRFVVNYFEEENNLNRKEKEDKQ